MTDLKPGILLWSQGATWPEMLDAAKRVDRLGYTHLWTWDHLYAIFGDPYQPIFEGWSLLAAWARETTQTRLGLLVGANTFRNPGLVAKTATTLDHVSDGRAILGIGGAWMELEHQAHGIDFGSGFGQRLDWLDESVGGDARGAGRRVGDVRAGWPVHVRRPPSPARAGPAAPPDHDRRQWREEDPADGRPNTPTCGTRVGPVDVMAHKIEVLKGHCEAVGRDIDEIEFTLGVKLTIRDSKAEAKRVRDAAMVANRTPDSEVADDDTFWEGSPEEIADRLRPYVDLGFTTVISEQPAPYDVETFERFIGEVKPLIDAG